MGFASPAWCRLSTVDPPSPTSTRRAAGDVVAQRIERRPVDSKRCAMTTAYGGLFNGTVGHAWYLKLDAVARQFFLPGSRRFVAAKVVADSAIFGPIHVAAFFTLLTLAEGGTFKDVNTKLKTDFFSTLSAEFTIWPIVQFVHFSKVPVAYQLLVVNAFTVGDATFMSWVQHKPGWFGKLVSHLHTPAD